MSLIVVFLSLGLSNQVVIGLPMVVVYIYSGVVDAVARSQALDSSVLTCHRLKTGL